VLSGGGKIALSSSGNNFFSVGTTTTLTNLDNTIVGAGNLGDGSTPLILVNGGTINANSANALTINVPEPITNSGIMERPAPAAYSSVPIMSSIIPAAKLRRLAPEPRQS
jgi:hypothetical protein